MNADAGSTAVMSSARYRFATYMVVVALAGGLMTAAVCRVKPLLSANDRSRWDTVWSLVERGTYKIDEIDAVPGWGTIDKVRHEGHFYSSKPPFLSTIVAGVYWVVKGLTGWRLDEQMDAQTDQTARLILFLVNVVPMLVGIAVMGALVERYARTDFARVFIVATFALATFLTTYSVTLNNHTPAALAILFSTYACCRILADGANSPVHYALAGFFAAFAAANELPAAAFAAAVALLLFWRSPARTLAWFVPAAIIPVAAFVALCYVASGDWRPFYYFYGTDKYKYVVNGVPSYWMNPGGLDANVEPWWRYLLHCTFGHHGIFSLSPVFLLSLAAWCVPPLSRHFRLRLWLWLSAGLTVIVMAFYLTRTQNYNYGGNTSGLRRMFWLVPLWMVSLIPVLDGLEGRRGFQTLACALLAVTAFSSWYPIDNPWQHPWLYRLMERWGWIDYRHPVEPFTRPVTTFFPLSPSGESGGEWIEFAAADPGGETTHLRLIDQGPAEQDGRRLRKVAAVWNRGTPRERTMSFSIDVAAFDKGAAPSAFLVFSDTAADARARQSAESFLQGLPTTRAYRRGNLRYVTTALRTDAFECRLAAAQISREDSRTGGSNLYRIDVWLTSAVPFGVLQFDQTVRDGESDDLLSYRRFTAVAASRATPTPSGAAKPLNIP